MYEFCTYIHSVCNMHVAYRYLHVHTHMQQHTSDVFYVRDDQSFPPKRNYVKVNKVSYRKRWQFVIVTVWRSIGVFPCHVISLLPTWLPRICRPNSTSSFWGQVVLYLVFILWYDPDQLSACVCVLSMTPLPQILILIHSKWEHNLGLTWH